MRRATITPSYQPLFSGLPEVPAMHKPEPGGREISLRREDPPTGRFLASLEPHSPRPTWELAYCHANAPQPSSREKVFRSSPSRRHRYPHSDRLEQV